LRAIAGAVIATVAGVKATDGANATIVPVCVNNYGTCQSDGQCCAGAVCEWGMCMPGCRIDGAFAHPMQSPPGNSCQVCNPQVSTTAGIPVNEGMTCWSGDPFAGSTTCQSGACVPVGSVKCPPITACHLEGEVDPTNGMCTYPFAPAGTPCGIGEMCHGGFYQPADACDGNGFCIGGGSKTVSCAPYSCAGTACATTCSSDSECGNGTVCCDGRCISLGTIDHCSACGDVCETADTCTPPSCNNGVCNSASICTPVDACTPARCLSNGTCNATSACTGINTCGGGGVAGQCGFTCGSGTTRCGNGCVGTPPIPNTTIGNHVAWLVDQLNGGAATLTEAEFNQHMAPGFSFDGIRSFFLEFAPFRPNYFGGFIGTPTATSASFILVEGGTFQQQVDMRLDADSSLINVLVFSGASVCS
jgi:hypothetical protein